MMRRASLGRQHRNNEIRSQKRNAERRRSIERYHQRRLSDDEQSGGYASSSGGGYLSDHMSGGAETPERRNSNQGQRRVSFTGGETTPELPNPQPPRNNNPESSSSESYVLQLIRQQQQQKQAQQQSQSDHNYQNTSMSMQREASLNLADAIMDYQNPIGGDGGDPIQSEANSEKSNKSSSKGGGSGSSSRSSSWKFLKTVSGGLFASSSNNKNNKNSDSSNNKNKNNLYKSGKTELTELEDSQNTNSVVDKSKRRLLQVTAPPPDFTYNESTTAACMSENTESNYYPPTQAAPAALADDEQQEVGMMVTHQSKKKKSSSERSGELVDDNDSGDDDEDSNTTKSKHGIGGKIWEKWNLFRKHCGIIDHPKIQWFIIILIVINAIWMGIATFDFVTEDANMLHIFDTVDKAFLIIFTIECAMEIVHHGLWYVLTDAWLCFDFIIVVASWSFESLQVVRAFRILRAVRLIAKMETLKSLIRALADVGPSILSILFLLILIVYIFAVLCTNLFGHMYDDALLDVDYFGSLGATSFTLFQFVTLADWGLVVRQVDQVYYWSWPIFIMFIVISSFILYSLVIAVVCDSVQNIAEQRHQEEERQLHEEEKEIEVDVRKKLQKMQNQLDAMKEQQRQVLTHYLSQLQQDCNLTLDSDNMSFYSATMAAVSQTGTDQHRHHNMNPPPPPKGNSHHFHATYNSSVDNTTTEQQVDTVPRQTRSFSMHSEEYA